MNRELLLICLSWISDNAPHIVQILVALVPVLAISVVGYAIHVMSKGGRKK